MQSFKRAFKVKKVMVFLPILVLSGQNSGLHFWHAQENFLYQTLFFRKHI